MRVGVIGVLVLVSGQGYAQEATSPWTDATPPAETPEQEAAPSGEPVRPREGLQPAAGGDAPASTEVAPSVDALPAETLPSAGDGVPASTASAPALEPPALVTTPVVQPKAAAKAKKRKGDTAEVEAAVAALVDAADGADPAALDALPGALGSLEVALGGTGTAPDAGEATSAATLPSALLEQAAEALPTVVEALGGAPDAAAVVVPSEGAPAEGVASSVAPEAPAVAPTPVVSLKVGEGTGTPPVDVPTPVRSVAAPVVVVPTEAAATVVAHTAPPPTVRAAETREVAAPPVLVVPPPVSPAAVEPAPVARDVVEPAEVAATPSDGIPPQVLEPEAASANVYRLGGDVAYEVQTLGGGENVVSPPAAAAPPVAAAPRTGSVESATAPGLAAAPRDLRRRVPELPVAYEAILGTKRIVCQAEVRLQGDGRADRVGVTACPAAMKLAVADALTDWRWPDGPSGWFTVEVPVARSVRGASGRLYHPGFTELGTDRPATGSRDLPVLVKSGKMPIYPRQVYHGDATCLVSATILRNGKSSDVRIDDCTTPYRVELNKVVKGWRWYPAEVDGEPTTASIEFEVAFRLEQAAR